MKIDVKNVKLFPGDVIMINGERVWADRTVVLSSRAPSFERIPMPGITDLPETPLRITELWECRGHRAKMEPIFNLRCQCGSVYTRKSDTHHSCQHCGRAWTNDDVDAILK